MYIKQVPINKYVAEDGKEFSNESDCLYYEKRMAENKYKSDLKEEINKIRHIYYSPPLSDDCYDYVWYYITNDEELSWFKEYCKKFMYDEFDVEITSLPLWIGIKDAGDPCLIGTLEQYLSDVDEFKNELKDLESLKETSN